MAAEGFVGHEQIVERFRCSARHGRLAGTYLFAGPPGIGKRTFALWLAQALLCEVNPESELQPCGRCLGCVQVKAGTHPDLNVVDREEGSSVIKIDQLIGPPENRNQEGFCHDISLKPFRGRRRVGIINDAEDLNVEGANSLLKTLEEPPPGAVLILISSSLQKQLPTIRSRAQVVPFQPLSAIEVAEILVARGLVEDRAQAEELASLSGGSIQQALEFASPEVREYRTQLLKRLAQIDFDPVAAARELTDFLGAGGADGAAKRRRLRQVMFIAAEFYRALLHTRTGLTPEGDRLLVQAVEAAHQRQPWTLRAIDECLDRCLVAEQQVAENANQATMIEAWFDDLSMRGATLYR